MFGEYQLDVLTAYHDCRAAGKLSLNLTRPTAAKLRDECVAVYNRKFQKSDLRTLRSFFELGDDERAYEALMRRFDPDKFRPLNKFLNGKIRSTDERNIELLAWLIDFQPRPYISGEQYRHEKAKIAAAGQQAEVAENSSPGNSTGSANPRSDGDVVFNEPVEQLVSILQQPTTSWWSGTGLRSAVVTVATLVLGALIIYTVGHKPLKPSFTLTGECMYWKSDHYEPVACNRTIANAVLVPLDRAKVAGFKKITDTHFITQSSFAAFWYSKINGQVEFYTAGGVHPVDTVRTLRPVTRYMFDKYILNSYQAVKPGR